jgi:hypothetical protein
MASKDWRELTELELIKRAHNDPQAAKALAQVQEINARGGLPVIRYSEFNGYSVRDKNE